MTKRHRIVFLLLFFVSGFSGLIYESIWTHYFHFFLGHAAYAQTLVLSIFMGGLAIGSYLASRYSLKWKNLFFAYALAEGIIGVLALFFHESFLLLIEISFHNVFHYLGSPFSIDLYKWITGASLILPQSILLGMTFPLMSAALLRAFPASPGNNISLLYFTNSLGAAIGILLCGFYFLDVFGLPGTIKLAGVINILIAVIVLSLINRHRSSFKASFEPGIEKIKAQKTSSTYLVLLGVSAFTGMASFIYEIGWIRMLNLVLGTSTHAFELMLSAFILGLALGGLWIRKRIDKLSNPIAYLGYIQLIMGFLALTTLLTYGNTFSLMEWMLETLSRDDQGYFLFNLSSNGIALLIMFPVTFCAGMTLPLITTILLGVHGEKSIGTVYAWNTIGAIAGIFLAVHFGMPVLGLKGLISLGAGIDIVLGLLLLFVFCSQKNKFTLKIIVGSLGVIALIYSIFFVHLDPIKMASGVFRGMGMLSPEKTEIIFHKDGKTATISTVLYKGRDANKDVLSIKTNGKADASIWKTPHSIGTEDESTMIQLAVLPMALHPTAKDVAIIGFGSGISTRSILRNTRIQNLHTIEIEEQMINGAKMLGPQIASVFSDPRSKIIIDDAKTYFYSGKKKYDIILSEPSNPWVSGVAELFSVEFYHMINHHLNKGGVFSQWIQLYGLDMNMVASVLKAVSQSFPDYQLYALNDHDALVIAKKDGLLPPLDSLLLASPGIAADLYHVNVNSIQDIEFRFLGNKKILDPFLESYSIAANSDFYPVLEENAARLRFIGINANEIYGFTHHYHPLISMLTDKKPKWDTTRVTQSFFHRKTREANEAMALRDFYLHDDFDLNYPNLPENIRNGAKLVKNSFGATSNNKGGQDRVSLLFHTSIRMTPYLTSVEMEKVWEVIGVNQDSTLTYNERAWLSIFQAEGQRDAKTMVSVSEYLLLNNPSLPMEPKEYLVSAVMLGYIMQGKFDKATIFWQEYEGKLSDNPRSILLFRFLAAQCNSVTNTNN